ncbi:hypothetical protein [Burkholderia ambifaria]|uniref:hypothetical protein n=1 Tax=Burkholderia ambifaria TaxID=152480 RepID=UPI000F800D74|nr:hypothetical protein [Burkholderia ambifaria]
MHYVLRYLFYAAGLVVLTYLLNLNPERAQFADLVRLVQSPETWRDVVLAALFLAAFDLTWWAATAPRFTRSSAQSVVPRKLADTSPAGPGTA